MTHYRLACAATGLVLAALAGCTVPGAATTQSVAPASGGAAGTTAGTPAGNPTVDAKSAADSGIDPANPPKALATTAMTSALGTLHVDVVRMKRTDKLLNVVFALKPEMAKPETKELYYWLGANTFWHPFLIDPKNLKKYGVIGDDPVQSGLSSRYMSTIAPGVTTYVYAVFAAPPADVTALDVTFSSTAAPMLGVPIS